MLIYTARKTNFSFYEEGESHTREEWKTKLELTDEQFNDIAAVDFDSKDTEEIIFTVVKTQPLGQNEIVIGKNSDTTGLSGDEVKRLSPLIELLLKDFNIQS